RPDRRRCRTAGACQPSLSRPAPASLGAGLGDQSRGARVLLRALRHPAGGAAPCAVARAGLPGREGEPGAGGGLRLRQPVHHGRGPVPPVFLHHRGIAQPGWRLLAGRRGALGARRQGAQLAAQRGADRPLRARRARRLPDLVQGPLHRRGAATACDRGADEPEHHRPDPEARGDRRRRDQDRGPPAKPRLRREGDEDLARGARRLRRHGRGLRGAAAVEPHARRPFRRQPDDARRLPPAMAMTMREAKAKSDLRLALGPVLFFWPKAIVLDFYSRMVGLPLDVIYLGETVCSKRREMSGRDWLALARDIAGAGRAQVVLSGLALIEAASELSSLKRLCENGEFMVEANDMAAVRFLARQGLPFVAGPALNLYNGAGLAELVGLGVQRWVPPVECSGATIAAALAELDAAGIPRPEVEVFAHGYLPLAYSARCFTARLAGRPKDDC